MVSRNQKRAIGLPSKSSSRQKHPTWYKAKEAKFVSTSPERDSLNSSACFTASLSRVKPRQLGGRSAGGM